MKNPKFGDTILIRHKLVRKVEYKHEPDKPNRIGYRNTLKVWKEKEMDAAIEVIFLGFRTLSNGIRYHEDYGYSYRPTEYFKAALVCEGPNKNPYYAKIPLNNEE